MSLDIGAMFTKTEKGEKLKAQMDDFIARIKREGTLDEIYDYWRRPSRSDLQSGRPFSTLSSRRPPSHSSRSIAESW